MKRRLGVLLTHPVQYYAPLFRSLARRPDIDLRVYYGLAPTPEQQGDGFGTAFQWDMDLLSGYESEFLDNRSRSPSVSSEDFGGCDTPGIAEIVRQRGFDAFLPLGWGSKCYLQAILACRRAGIPVFVRGDTNLISSRSRGIKRYVRGQFLRWLIPRYSGCLSVGTRAADFYRHYGADESRIFMSPHFVDNAFFAEQARTYRSERAELRRSYGFRSDTAVYLFVGKFIEKKRPLDLLKALDAVVEGGGPAPRSAALMVGDGPLLESCKAYAAERALPVSFPGFMGQTEVGKAYAAADALVLPSDATETWGLVTNEAMATGLPVIVSAQAGCAPDLVIDGLTGYQIQPGDVGGLADALGRMADDDERARMGDQALRLIARFNVERAAEGIAEALASVGEKGA